MEKNFFLLDSLSSSPRAKEWTLQSSDRTWGHIQVTWRTVSGTETFTYCETLIWVTVSKPQLQVSSYFYELSCTTQREPQWEITEWHFQEETSFSRTLFLQSITAKAKSGKNATTMQQATQWLPSGSWLSDTHHFKALHFGPSSLHLFKVASFVPLIILLPITLEPCI